MTERTESSEQQNGQLTIFEVVPAFVGIVTGFAIGHLIYQKTDSVVYGVVGGILTTPVVFILTAYSFFLAVLLLFAVGSKLFGRTSPRDEFFDDP